MSTNLSTVIADTTLPLRATEIMKKVTSIEHGRVPAPSTDSFGHYEPGYESPSLKYTKQVPRLGYNHWAVTTEAVRQYEPLVQWYERTIYGEIRSLGLLPRP
jgi:hypothetical protein